MNLQKSSVFGPLSDNKQQNIIKLWEYLGKREVTSLPLSIALITQRDSSVETYRQTNILLLLYKKQFNVVVQLMDKINVNQIVV